MIDDLPEGFDEALNNRYIVARGASDKGEALLAPILQELQDFYGYPLSFVSRPGKEKDRAYAKAHQLYNRDRLLHATTLVAQLTDLAGGRVLVNGINDANHAIRHLVERLRRDCVILDGPENCLKESGSRFHRVLIEVYTSQGSCPFELQVMTFLQHAWDKAHHAVYERIRENSETPEDLNKAFLNLSSKLYEIDLLIDKLQREWHSRSRSSSPP